MIGEGHSLRKEIPAPRHRAIRSPRHARRFRRICYHSARGSESGGGDRRKDFARASGPTAHRSRSGRGTLPPARHPAPFERGLHCCAHSSLVESTRSVFAAPSLDVEVIAEVLIPIRIRRHDKTSQETQSAGSERAIGSVTAATTACYTDRKPKFRVLCGSI